MTDKKKIEVLQRMVDDLKKENTQLKEQLASSQVGIIEEYKEKQQALMSEMFQLREKMRTEVDVLKQEQQAYKDIMYREFGIKGVERELRKGKRKKISDIFKRKKKK
jgi:hypothetical protein